MVRVRVRVRVRVGDSGHGDLEFGDLKFSELKFGEMERNCVMCRRHFTGDFKHHSPGGATDRIADMQWSNKPLHIF